MPRSSSDDVLEDGQELKAGSRRTTSILAIAPSRQIRQRTLRAIASQTGDAFTQHQAEGWSTYGAERTHRRLLRTNPRTAQTGRGSTVRVR